MNAQQSDTDTERASALAGELRILVGKLKRRLREQAPRLGDLTWSQVAVLGRLEREGPATVTTLARAESMRPQSMGAIVSVLASAGFVTRSPDPDDGRQTILFVTAASREWLKASRAAREDWLSRAIQTKLAPAEREELTRAAALLHRLVES